LGPDVDLSLYLYTFIDLCFENKFVCFVFEKVRNGH